MSEPTRDAPAPQGGRAVALRNMAWLLGDKALALVVGLAIQGLIARSLGPAGSGHFAYAAAMLQTGLGLSLVCAGVALLPRFCRMHGALPGAIANIFVLRMVASVLAMLAMMAFTLLTVDEPPRRQATLILLLAVPLIEPFYILATYWLSRNHNRPTVVARSSGLLLRAAIVAAGVAAGAPTWVLAAAWVLEAGLNAGLQAVQARGAFAGHALRARVRPSRMKQYLGFGLRYVVALWMAQLFLRLDRLVLAERLDPHDFGIYAAPMQLVEVWSQVAYLVGSSIASAYLYRRLRAREGIRAFVVTAAAMAGIGAVGLAGAWLVGPTLLHVVYGPAFAASLPFLVAGAAFAVMLFIDQAVDMLIMGLNLPHLLAIKWTLAVVVAGVVLNWGFARWGAFSGPIGMALGVLIGWIGLLVLPTRWRGGGGGVRGSARTPSDAGTAGSSIQRAGPESRAVTSGALARAQSHNG